MFHEVLSPGVFYGHTLSVFACISLSSHWSKYLPFSVSIRSLSFPLDMSHKMTPRVYIRSSSSCEEIPVKSNLRKEGLIVAHSLMVHPIMM